MIFALRKSHDGLHELDQGQEQGDHDHAHDPAQHHHHDGLEQADQAGDGDVDLFVVVVRDFQEHLVQVTGFFADVDHVDDQGVADLGFAEGLGEGVPLADAGVHVHEGVGVDAVAGGFAGDGDGVEDGHAGVHQGAQGSGELGDGGLANQAAQHGGKQGEAVEEGFAGAGFPQHLDAEEDEEGRGQHPDDAGDHLVFVVGALFGAQHAEQGAAEPLAHVDEPDGEGGHVGVEVVEDLNELGHDEDHDAQHDDAGDADDRGGVDHRADDAGFEPGGFFEKLGQAGEDEVEHTADFAGGDHLGVEDVEGLGVFGEGVAERGTRRDVFVDVLEGVLHEAGLLLLLEDGERAEDGQAGVLQGGELAGEEGEVLLADPADVDGHAAGLLLAAGPLGGAATPAAAATLLDLLLADGGGEEALALDACERFFVVGGGDGALLRLAGVVEGFELVGGHGGAPGFGVG